MPAKVFDESREEMERILREETLGYLGLSMDGMPYVVPLNYGYVEGRILFHCAPTGRKLSAVANTWSPPCGVTAPTLALGTLAELEAAELAGRIVILYSDLVKEHGYGARSAFYFPEGQRRVIGLLEEKGPAAILTVNTITGCLERLIRDWEFPIPSATVAAEVGLTLLRNAGQTVHLRIDGRRLPDQFHNVVAYKVGTRPERIVLLAHLDTQAGTPGACDNASGVAVLLALAEYMARKDLSLGLEWIAVNGEEVGGLGDAEYLRRRGDTLGPPLRIERDADLLQHPHVTMHRTFGNAQFGGQL